MLINKDKYTLAAFLIHQFTSWNGTISDRTKAYEWNWGLL